MKSLKQASWCPVATSRRRLIGMSLTAAMGLVAACAAPPAPTTAPSTQKAAPAATSGTAEQWVISIGAELSCLDPIDCPGGFEPYLTLPHIFDALVEYQGPENRLTPLLAESWKPLNDTAWELRLRSGVKFHDGTPFTAEDVVYSYEQAKDPKSPVRSYVAKITKVSAVDAGTVRVETDGAYAPLLGILRQVMMVPQKSRGQMGIEGFGRQPVGTGPYRLVEWQRDQRMVLEANPNYWRGAPSPKRLVLRPIRDVSTRVSELLAGGLDIANGVSLPQVAQVKSNPNLELITINNGQRVYYPLNPTFKPFSDVRVRQAANYAVDRFSIVKDLLQGFGEVSRGVFTTATAGHDPNLKPYPYDPERAKQLLKEAGYGDGFDVNWQISQGVAVMGKEIAELTANQLGKVGIRAKLQVLERAKLNEFLQQNNFEMTEQFWTAQADDENMLRYALYNKGYYADARASELIDAQSRALDQGKRLEIIGQLDRYLQDQAPWLFTRVEPVFYGIRKGLNWKPYARGGPATYFYFFTIPGQVPGA